MSKHDDKRPSLARRLPLWGFALLAGLLFGVIAMLVGLIIGLQTKMVLIAGAAVCCTTFSLTAFLEAAAEFFMAVVEAILSVFAAILAAVAVIFSSCS